MYLRSCNTKNDIRVRIVPTVEDQVTVHPENIIDWGTDCKETVNVLAKDNSLEEGIHFVTFSHIVTDASGNNVTLTDNLTLFADNMMVYIYDDKIPGGLIKETLDFTSTAKLNVNHSNNQDPFFGKEELYEDKSLIQLSKQPNANVTVTVESIKTMTN